MELIMAIALWCGNPGYTKLTEYQVNNCRQKIVLCYDTNKIISDNARLYECAKNVKIGE